MNILNFNKFFESSLTIRGNSLDLAQHCEVVTDLWSDQRIVAAALQNAHTYTDRSESLKVRTDPSIVPKNLLVLNSKYF